MNSLLKRSIKLKTGRYNEQEVKRIYIVYHGNDINPDESMIFTYPAITNPSKLPNLNMQELIARSSSEFNGFFPDWFSDQSKLNQEDTLVIS